MALCADSDEAGQDQPYRRPPRELLDGVAPEHDNHAKSCKTQGKGPKAAYLFNFAFTCCKTGSSQYAASETPVSSYPTLQAGNFY